MDPWLLWLIAAVIFAVGEIATLGFFLAPFAGGALVAALVPAVGAGDIASAVVVHRGRRCSCCSPLAAARALAPPACRPQLRTGTAALVGR